MGDDLAIISLVGLCFFCRSENIHTLTRDCGYLSVLIIGMSTYIYNPHQFHSNCTHLILSIHSCYGHVTYHFHCFSPFALIDTFQFLHPHRNLRVSKSEHRILNVYLLFFFYNYVENPSMRNPCEIDRHDFIKSST
jgi:hypothetical protein